MISSRRTRSLAKILGLWSNKGLLWRRRKLRALLPVTLQIRVRMLDRSLRRSQGLQIHDTRLIKNNRIRTSEAIKKMTLQLRFKTSMVVIKRKRCLKRKLNTFKMKRGIKNTTRKRMQASKLLKSVMV